MGFIFFCAYRTCQKFDDKKENDFDGGRNRNDDDKESVLELENKCVHSIIKKTSMMMMNVLMQQKNRIEKQRE